MVKYETYLKDKFSSTGSQLPSGYTEGNGAETFRNIFNIPVLSGWSAVEPMLTPTKKGKVNGGPQTAIANTGLPIQCLDASAGQFSASQGPQARHMSQLTYHAENVPSTWAHERIVRATYPAQGQRFNFLPISWASLPV